MIFVQSATQAGQLVNNFFLFFFTLFFPVQDLLYGNQYYGLLVSLRRKRRSFPSNHLFLTKLEEGVIGVGATTKNDPRFPSLKQKHSPFKQGNYTVQL